VLYWRSGFWWLPLRRSQDQRRRKNRRHRTVHGSCSRPVPKNQPCLRRQRQESYGGLHGLHAWSSAKGNGGLSGWSKSKERLDSRLPEARQAASGKRAQTMWAWRLHDIRRSVATGMAEIGIQPHIVEAVLNYVSGQMAGVAGVYNRTTYAPS
jgi:hypothetical protein